MRIILKPEIKNPEFEISSGKVLIRIIFFNKLFSFPFSGKIVCSNVNMEYFSDGIDYVLEGTLKFTTHSMKFECSSKSYFSYKSLLKDPNNVKKNLNELLYTFIRRMRIGK